MSTSPSLVSINRTVWTALMAALIAAGAMVVIPVGPVAISLQTMFVLLAGLILGPRRAVYAVLIYLAAGLLGLPVFLGGKAGLASLLGPTGGFLLGFLPAACISGVGSGAGTSRSVALLSCGLASLVILILGSLQLSYVLNVSLVKAATLGMFPFLLGDAAKCFAAVAAYRFLLQRKLLPL